MAPLLASVTWKLGGSLHPHSGLRANASAKPSVAQDLSYPLSLQGSQVLAATYNQAAQLWKVGETQSKVRPGWDAALGLRVIPQDLQSDCLRGLALSVLSVWTGDIVWTQGQSNSCQIQANKAPGSDREPRPDSEGVGPGPRLL